MASKSSEVTFHFEPKYEQQYGGPTWVIVRVGGKNVARVDWINGPPYLRAEANPPHRGWRCNNCERVNDSLAVPDAICARCGETRGTY